MSTNQNPETPAGISPADIYFVLFRHKWKILILTILGLVAATVFFFTNQPLYQSESEIFIKYVSDSHALNPSENGSQETKLIDMDQNVMNSEMAILKSYDLAAKVATNFGPDKILAKLGGGDSAVAAASVVQSHLKVETMKDSSVIYVIFSHPDPDLVQPVLSEIISDYLDEHTKVHSAIGMSDDLLDERITQLRLEIAQTEDLLRIEKTNAGIISVADTEKSYSEEMARIHDELLQARASLFEHQTSLKELASAESKGGITNTILNVPTDKTEHYKSVCAQLNFYQQRENNYIQQGYTEENKLMRENRELILAATKTKTDLEKEFPALADLDTTTAIPPTTDTAHMPAPAGNSEQTALLPVRIKVLEDQLQDVQAEAAKLNDAEAKINDLDRTYKVQDNNLTYYENLRDQTRIDSQLGPNRNSNISQIQHPEPAYRDYTKFYKVIGVLAFSGLLLGLAWAFLIEFYLDRSVKRPVDLQTKLHIPFFLSIPDLNHNSRGRLAAPERKQLAFNGDKKAAETNGALEITSPKVNHALHSHYDALRDRLVNYFESINLTRKPKLVAVTSASKGAGVSTISAGLAASLSETGDGRVLLVDMNLENGAAQQFVRGLPGCQLDDALVSDRRDNALVQENLYVVSEGSNADKLPRILPKRFASLIPKLKASDYDYIIFDMPPVTQTSVTTRLAGFMDTVMLVVESEKTDRDVVHQAHQLLQQSKANVTAVLNKTRKYTPARLQHDIHADM
jgi:succinoglycan biosynthesis transport protein ExoP